MSLVTDKVLMLALGPERSRSQEIALQNVVAINIHANGAPSQYAGILNKHAVWSAACCPMEKLTLYKNC